MSATPVADMEAEFKERWIAQRTATLSATGLSTEAAQTQAQSDYANAYQYTRAKK